MVLPSIADKIKQYHGSVREPHDRDRSWEHCYKYFYENDAEIIKRERRQAALQLGFYLASWGMYRGSSFLLQYAFTIHEGIVDVVLDSKFSQLWNKDFGSRNTDFTLAPLIFDLCQEIKKAYQPFAKAKNKTVRDMLLTKVVLGTVGCFPAWDTYFDIGYRQCGFRPPSQLTVPFIEEVLQFCLAHIADFKSEQSRIDGEQNTPTSLKPYPLMKLEDMYFHEIGVELDQAEPGGSKH
jgi:hypothetical protein